MEWDGNRRAISYMSNVLVTASQEVMEEPLKLCNAIKIPARSFVVAPTYCSQMFTGRVCARPSDEQKHKFPNPYIWNLFSLTTVKASSKRKYHI